ncbi:hypothetical protein C8J55DRAFT_255786 [Lentinula edodes]|uniref:Uncharacterized protein n=1 Tax=Lentinula lateritia TaxID=40482 RepID=A0A9W9AYU8_9AGAR|nr:hypothetical protein C8J55DRAFT_255786 [Lentinula edodes]
MLSFSIILPKLSNLVLICVLVNSILFNTVCARPTSLAVSDLRYDPSITGRLGQRSNPRDDGLTNLPFYRARFNIHDFPVVIATSESYNPKEKRKLCIGIRCFSTDELGSSEFRVELSEYRAKVPTHTDAAYKVFGFVSFHDEEQKRSIMESLIKEVPERLKGEEEYYRNWMIGYLKSEKVYKASEGH